MATRQHVWCRSNIFASSKTAADSPTSSLLDGARRRLSEGALSSSKQPAGLPSPEKRHGTSTHVTPLRLPQASLLSPRSTSFCMPLSILHGSALTPFHSCITLVHICLLYGHSSAQGFFCTLEAVPSFITLSADLQGHACNGSHALQHESSTFAPGRGW